MSHFAHEGVRLHYEVIGRGRPLLLLMGFRLASDAWPPTFLGHLGKGRQLILMDNRGTGRSDRPTKGYALGEVAGDAVALMDHLRIEQFDILGFSMGGGVAQEVALRWSSRVRRLVLCATWCGRARGVRAPMKVLRMVEELNQEPPEVIHRRIWPYTYSTGFLAGAKEAAEYQLTQELKHQTPAYVGGLQIQALAHFDSWHRLPRVTCPTLVLTGDSDRLVPPSNSEVLASRIPGARLVQLPDVGHRLFWEQPAACAREVTGFLEEATTASTD